VVDYVQGAEDADFSFVDLPDAVNGNLPDTAAAPEPSTWAMMAVGFAAVGVFYRRRARFTPACEASSSPVRASPGILVMMLPGFAAAGDGREAERPGTRGSNLARRPT
jgi:hypothetical protein